MSVSDPVASGIVESLARPGAAFTGVSNNFPTTAAKMLEYVRLVAPEMKHADVIRDAANPGKTLDVAEIRAGAQLMGITILDRGVRNGAEIERAFAGMRERRPDVLLVLVDGVTLSNRDQIVALAAADRQVTIYQVRDFVEAGGLMSFGLNFCRHFAQAASHADKILRGAKPQDLPVELPTGFEFVINVKTAAALGMAVPPALLARAEEVIE
jgi:putative ABC transport system substrate-binding protein